MTNMDKKIAASSMRLHPRQDVVVEISFRYPRDYALYEAVLQDISHGGVGFLCDHLIEPNTYIRIFIHAHDPDHAPHGTLVRVAYVTPVEDGLFRCGGQFMPEGTIDDHNRRKNQRTPCNHRVEYHIFGDRETFCMSPALDLSRTGISFASKAPMREGELLKLQFQGLAEIFQHKYLQATGRVIHVTPLDDRRLHVGIELLKTTSLNRIMF